MEFCAPTIVYLLLSAICFITGIAYGSGLFTIIISILWIIVWTLLLNYLCSSNWKFLAWVLVLLPFIIIFFMITLFIGMLLFEQSMMDDQDNSNKPIQYNYDYDYTALGEKMR